MPRSLRDFRPTREHIPVLDGVRAVAVLLVLWAHLPHVFGRADVAIRYLVVPGYLGVDLFFVLSGFLITRIMLADRSRDGSMKRFMMRRFLRIFPIYYLTIAAIWLYQVVAHQWSAIHLPLADMNAHLISCALYLSNFTFAFVHDPGPLRHTWSLAVEEHFYLFWPMVVYLTAIATSYRAILRVLLPLSVLLAIGTVAIDSLGVIDSLRDQSGWSRDLIFRATPYRIWSLLLGAALAYHESQLFEHPERLRRLIRNAAIVAIAFVGVTKLERIGAVPVGVREVIATWSPVLRLVGYGALSLTLVSICLLLRNSTGIVTRVLCSAPMRFIGRISYGLYLYHYVVYVAFGIRHSADDHGASIVTVVAAVAVSFLVAWASYMLIERPILRFKDRFRTG